ncbi:MAG: hypothetical protein IJL48_07350 [Bacteroidales bacterium]|nr:hypothetical protein [Bacteroidales bacterium]
MLYSTVCVVLQFSTRPAPGSVPSGPYDTCYLLHITVSPSHLSNAMPSAVDSSISSATGHTSVSHFNIVSNGGTRGV